MRLLAAGASNQRIADSSDIPQHGARPRPQPLDETQVHSRAKAVALAVQQKGGGGLRSHRTLTAAGHGT